jgi:hypothetical protein
MISFFSSLLIPAPPLLFFLGTLRLLLTALPPATEPARLEFNISDPAAELDLSLLPGLLESSSFSILVCSPDLSSSFYFSIDFNFSGDY